MKLDISKYTKHAGHVVAVNSPQILTALGVAGTLGTAYLTFKATWKARDVVVEQDPIFDPKSPKDALTKTERALLVWKLYIPAVTSGAMTIGCIVAANRVQARRMAALAAAYAVLSGDFDEYKSKAQELLGVKKSAELNEARARKAIENTPAPKGGIILPDGKSWFLDKTSGRYHITTMETVKGVQNELNYTIINHGDASLNDFYAQLGMDPVRVGDLLGWNRKHKVEMSFTPLLTEDRGAVTAFEFIRGPIPDFWKYKGKVDPDEISDLGA